MPQCATLRKAPTVAKSSPSAGWLLHRNKPELVSLPVYTCSWFESQSAGNRLRCYSTDSARQRRGQKRKRAGPSHKPHPKATCPHPTRPLLTPGRRARHDYAQLELKMQPQLEKFFEEFSRP